MRQEWRISYSWPYEIRVSRCAASGYAIVGRAHRAGPQCEWVISIIAAFAALAAFVRVCVCRHRNASAAQCSGSAALAAKKGEKTAKTGAVSRPAQRPQPQRLGLGLLAAAPQHLVVEFAAAGEAETETQRAATSKAVRAVRAPTPHRHAYRTGSQARVSAAKTKDKLGQENQSCRGSGSVRFDTVERAELIVRLSPRAHICICYPLRAATDSRGSMEPG